MDGAFYGDNSPSFLRQTAFGSNVNLSKKMS